MVPGSSGESAGNWEEWAALGEVGHHGEEMVVGWDIQWDVGWGEIQSGIWNGIGYRVGYGMGLGWDGIKDAVQDGWFLAIASPRCEQLGRDRSLSGWCLALFPQGEALWIGVVGCLWGIQGLGNAGGC